MPEDNLTPDNLENVEGAADNALDQLANALSGDSSVAGAPAVDPNVPTAPVADANANQPFSDPNAQVSPFTGGAPAADVPADALEGATVQMPAATPDYTQPTQVIDPAAQAAQAGYAQPTAAYDPNQQAYNQPGYGQPAYGQPGAPQPVYQGANPGTTPMVLGILSIVFAGLVGLILSIIGLKKAGPVLAADPNNGRAKAGKVTSIIGLIFSILAMLFAVAMMVGVIVLANDVENNPDKYVGAVEDIAQLDSTGQLQDDIDELKENLGMTDDSAAGAGAFEPTDADEAAVKSLVEEELDAIKNLSEADRKIISDEINSSFELFDMPLSKLGMTADEFTDWMVEGLSYETKDAVILSDGSGWVEADVTSNSFDDLWDAFDDEVTAWYDSDPDITSEDDAYKVMGELLREAMTKVTPSDKKVYIDVEQSNGNWEVNEQSVEYAIQDIFGLY